MEDINLYLVTLKQQIEIEYYKLKTANINVEINTIIEYTDNLNKNINDEQININKIKSNNLFLSDLDIEKLLIEYEDGTYGILNYIYNSVDQHKLVELIINNSYEFNNKVAIKNKLITNNKFSNQAIEESYGVLFIYKKENSIITDLKKVHLLKNNSIDFLNLDETEDKLITKIYEFGEKIVLKDAIYDSTFDQSELKTQSDEILDKLLIEKKQIDLLYKLVKKYNKYIEENIEQTDIKSLYLNFSFVNMLVKKLTSNTITKINIDNIINFNYVDILSNIKISNRLEQIDYDSIIERYFDQTIDELIDNTLITYNLDIKFRQYLNILFEILIRLYIDNYLGYKSYCLSRTLLEYLKFSSLLSDPETNTTTLKKRHWNQLLETKDNIKIISSILYLIKTKTTTIKETFKYFETIYTVIKIKY